jgi:deoxyribodipyrimidine photo-lyase
MTLRPASRALVWFRNDLRLHDHEPLQEAARAAALGADVVPVYCFDPRHFGTLRQTGLRKTGVHRARFLLESVADLRASLRRIGSDLVVACGRPEEVLPRLLHPDGLTIILAHTESMHEELGIERRLQSATAGGQVAFHSIWGGNTL